MSSTLKIKGQLSVKVQIDRQNHQHAFCGQITIQIANIQ